MKVILDGYEVEINARELSQKRATQLDTIEFLLYLKRVFVMAKETAMNNNLLLNRLDKDIDSLVEKLIEEKVGRRI